MAKIKINPNLSTEEQLRLWYLTPGSELLAAWVEKAVDEAFVEGKTCGLSDYAGQASDAIDDAYHEGYEDGSEVGYNEGYDVGFTAAENEDTEECKSFVLKARRESYRAGAKAALQGVQRILNDALGNAINELSADEEGEDEECGEDE